MLPQIQSLALSERQKLVWLAQQLHPDLPLYNVAFSFRFRFDLDPDRFARAFDRVARADASLRTVFRPQASGEPARAVLPEPPAALEFKDLRGEPDPEQRLSDALGDAAWTAFDLESCLYRSRLYRLADGDFRWLLAIHHLITDTISFQHLYRGVRASYEDPDAPLDFSQIDPAALPGAEADRRAAEAYWSEKLADHAPDFAFCGRASNGNAHRMRRAQRRFSSQEFAAVDRLQPENTSLQAHRFNFFASAYAAYLARLGDAHTPPIAMVYHGRKRPELKLATGFFIQMLPLLVDVRAGESLPGLMDRVRAESRLARQHSAATLANTRQNTFMHASLNLQIARFEPFGGAPVEVEWLSSGWNEHSLVLNVHSFSDEDLTVSLDISEDLHQEELSPSAADRFWALLDALLEDPRRCPAEVPLVTPAERDLVLHAWQGEDRPLADTPIASLFELQAARTPHAPAFRFESADLEFADLNHRANRLARLLQDKGAGPGETVAVCLEPGLEVPVAVLGVLKAGAAFVMVPPELPAARMERILAECLPCAAVTTARHTALLEAFPGPIVQLEEEPEALDGLEVGNPPPAATLDDPLYIAYTSGSTGQPKGVRIPQRQLMTLLYARWSAYPIEPGEVLCHKSPLGFVDSTIELFEGLLQGTPTVILSEPAVRDPAALAQAFARHRITRTRFIPEHLGLLIETVPDLAEKFSALRLLANTAAPIKPIELRSFSAALPHVRFINTFGLTELVTVSYAELPSESARETRLPIGRPIPNRTAYVLDRFLQPLPPGVPGELYLGGADLPIEFINLPEEVARRLLSDPFQPGRRMLATGDLARWREDGQLEHLGRRDHQVKIRGQRVELEEVEHHLARLAEVRQAAVRVIQRNSRDALAAYLVLKNGAGDPEGIRRRLAHSLPEASIPTSFVFLDAMPRTASGKVDRQNLPPVDSAAHSEAERSSSRPAGRVEERLAEIWRAVLGLGQVGREDNFLFLGGDSLAAMSIRSRVQQDFGTAIPIAAFFEAATIAEQAQLIQSSKRIKGIGQRLVLLRPGAGGPPLFLVPPAGSTVLAFQRLAPHIDPAYPVYGLQPWGIENEGRPHYRIPGMAAAYIREIRKEHPEGPYLLAGRCFGGIVVFEMACQLARAGNQLPLTAILDTQQPPNISRKTRLSGLAGIAGRMLRGEQFIPANHAQRIAEQLGTRSRAGSDLDSIDRVYRANWIGRYTYFSRRYPGRIDLFFGEPLANRPLDPGWIRAAAHVEVHTLPGDHTGEHSMMQEPNVRRLGEALNAAVRSNLGG